jgi:hypothetical protein
MPDDHLNPEDPLRNEDYRKSPPPAVTTAKKVKSVLGNKQIYLYFLVPLVFFFFFALAYFFIGKYIVSSRLIGL